MEWNFFRQKQSLEDVSLNFSLLCFADSMNCIASVGLRNKKFPNHEDYILTVGNCGRKTDPKPAIMADRLQELSEGFCTMFNVWLELNSSMRSIFGH